MADVLSGSVASSINWGLVETNSLGLQIPDNGNVGFGWTITDGVIAGKADKRWYIQRTALAAGGTDTYDLTALTLAVFGATETVNFARIRSIWFWNKGAVADAVQFGNAGSNAWKGFIAGTSPYLLVPGGGHINLIDPQGGWGVVDSSNKNLRINNTGAGALDYVLVLTGTSS